jgi:hypothetical protein
MFSAIFVGPLIVQKFKAKWSIFIGALNYCWYFLAAANPSVYTIVPASALLGLGASILWAGEGTYLTIAASNYALTRKEDRKSAMGMFNGLFFFYFSNESSDWKCACFFFTGSS